MVLGRAFLATVLSKVLVRVFNEMRKVTARRLRLAPVAMSKKLAKPRREVKQFLDWGDHAAELVWPDLSGNQARAELLEGLPSVCLRLGRRRIESRVGTLNRRPKKRSRRFAESGWRGGQGGQFDDVWIGRQGRVGLEDADGPANQIRVRNHEQSMLDKAFLQLREHLNAA